MTPSEREEIERYAQPVFNHNGWNTDGEPFKLTEVPLIKLPDGKYVLYLDHLTQVEKARAESKYIPSELELFTVLKKTYYENSELTGDQLWLKLSKSIRNKLNQKGE